MKSLFAKSMKRNIYLYFLLSLLLGAAVGLLTIFGQGHLEGHWNSLANLGPVWLVPAFLISSLGERKRDSILSCTLCLIGEVMGYYFFHSLIDQYAFSFTYFIFVWLGCAAVGGIIFGLAGYLWGHKEAKFHEAGSALLSGVFIADGLNMLIHLEDYKHMIPVPIAEIIFGLLLVLILQRTWRERLRCCRFLVPVIVLGLAGYTILFNVTI
ncbi:DUF6518 family protein [Domibacillus indicus]|uniref:DUF6518 family protein n=1 Tax=Domibacillus indicus TaxID=1437523 RepID=UPI000618168F|nr:DUF6518 family protein [Domibacillus indicus]